MGVAVGASRAFCLDDIAATSTRQSVSYFNVHVVPCDWYDIYQRVCMTLCICDFRSWTSGESHHVNVDLVVIDAVEAVVTRNDCRGVCL